MLKILVIIFLMFKITSSGVMMVIDGNLVTRLI